jgi:hypothetical protein
MQFTTKVFLFLWSKQNFNPHSIVMKNIHRTTNIISMKDYCEIYGTLEKLEELNTIKSNIIPGSLVFESLAPFWDYYYDTPGHGSVQYVYLGLDKDYVVFDIARTAAMVRESTGYNFDVAKASVTFSARFFQVVRLRHFGSYDQLKTIQEGFVRLGINPVFVGQLAETNSKDRVAESILPEQVARRRLCRQ